MSRGLGATQRRTLALLAETPGQTVAELALALGVSARYGRTVVVSLEDRWRVVVTTEKRERRVWLPEDAVAWQQAEFDRECHSKFCAADGEPPTERREVPSLRACRPEDGPQTAQGA